MAHFIAPGLYELEQAELVSGAYQVVVGVGDLVVGVAVEIVGQETGGLHEGEECDGKGQMAAFHGGEERACRLKVASGEGLEDVPTEGNVVQPG